MNRAARRLMKNTKIPLNEVIKSIEETKSESIKIANKHNTKMFLSASCLVLNKEFDFDKEKCLKFMNCVQNVVLDCLCASELNAEVIEKLDIDIDTIDSDEIGEI